MAVRTLLASAVLLAAAAPAMSQGLVWNLPPDGTEVVYGGTLKQTDIRPDGEETEMTWDRQLVIRSVGTQDVTRNGETVPGRWIEFELSTGRATEQGIDPGPVGRRIYRVLVAEPSVTDTPADQRGIPNAFLPVVEGYVQVADGAPQKLDAAAFQTYPSLALLMNYKPNELKSEGEEAIETPAGRFEATKYAAGATVESRSGRVQNAATLFVSPEMPFGLVRWNAISSRSSKDPNQPRDAYTVLSRIEETMEARAVNRNARGALSVSGR